MPRTKFPYKSPLGWTYDSGNYDARDESGAGYGRLSTRCAKNRQEKREKGELMGIGISSFTEVVGAGPAHTFDIAGIKMFDSAEIRVHPTGKAICRMGTKSQGQGHETTYAQIVAQELGIPAADVTVEEGDTDTAPYGLGTYASRSTPVSGAATAMAARKIREKAKKIAASSAGMQRGGSGVGAGQIFCQRRAQQVQDASRISPSPRTPTFRRGWSRA